MLILLIPLKDWAEDTYEDTYDYLTVQASTQSTIIIPHRPISSTPYFSHSSFPSSPVSPPYPLAIHSSHPTKIPSRSPYVCSKYQPNLRNLTRPHTPITRAVSSSSASCSRRRVFPLPSSLFHLPPPPQTPQKTIPSHSIPYLNPPAHPHTYIKHQRARAKNMS